MANYNLPIIIGISDLESFFCSIKKRQKSFKNFSDKSDDNL